MVATLVFCRTSPVLLGEPSLLTVSCAGCRIFRCLGALPRRSCDLRFTGVLPLVFLSALQGPPRWENTVFKSCAGCLARELCAMPHCAAPHLMLGQRSPHAPAKCLRVAELAEEQLQQSRWLHWLPPWSLLRSSGPAFAPLRHSFSVAL